MAHSSVHRQSASFLWDCSKLVHLGESLRQNKTSHLAVTKGIMMKRPMSYSPLEGHIPSDLKPPTRPHPLKILHQCLAEYPAFNTWAFGGCAAKPYSIFSYIKFNPSPVTHLSASMICAALWLQLQCGVWPTKLKTLSVWPVIDLEHSMYSLNTGCYQGIIAVPILHCGQRFSPSSQEQVTSGAF